MKVAVLGTGKTVRFYRPDNYDIAVGINTINQFFDSDYLVAIDPPPSDKAILDIIKSTPTKCLYTLSGVAFNRWDVYFKNVKHLKVIGGRGDLRGLDSEHIAIISSTSAYTAVGVAYHLGAKEIVMYGVDIDTHGKLKYFLMELRKHFRELKDELRRRGCELHCGHKESGIYSALDY